MSDDVLVKVEHVSKKFCRSLKRSLWYGVQDIAGELLGRDDTRDGLRKHEFWAVRDVSFELRRGECLGLIGRNGAGKTTLLRMLNGLIKPDCGRITIRGRVGALIALGAGFNPILTGRENIYINASVLGLTKKEIDAKFEEIVEFAEIGDFIDAPVQSYSSGMAVRLGFAVASALDPDLLLADEVLAVGDAAFRAKCYRKFADLQNRGTSVLLVSHQMPEIQRVCARCIWLADGRIASVADTPRVVSEYLAWSDAQEKRRDVPPESPPVAKASAARIVGIQTLKFDGEPSGEFRTGEQLRIRLSYEILSPVNGLNFSISITGNQEALYNGYMSLYDGLTVYPTQRIGHVELVFPKLCLGGGTYWLTASLADKDQQGLYDWRWQFAQFRVLSDSRVLGRFMFPHYWLASELGADRRFEALL